MRHQIAARVPDATYAQLKALAAFLQVSHAEVLTRALDALERSMSTSERALLRSLRERMPK